MTSERKMTAADYIDADSGRARDEEAAYLIDRLIAELRPWQPGEHPVVESYFAPEADAWRIVVHRIFTPVDNAPDLGPVTIGRAWHEQLEQAVGQPVPPAPELYRQAPMLDPEPDVVPDVFGAYREGFHDGMIEHKRIELWDRDTDQPEREYPHEDGDFLIIGPECFTRNDDDSMISYKGADYIEDRRVQEMLARARAEGHREREPEARAADQAQYGPGTLVVELSTGELWQIDQIDRAGLHCSREVDGQEQGHTFGPLDVRPATVADVVPKGGQ